MGHLLYSEAGVIIALTHVFLPFMVIALVGSLQQIDPSLARAAQILGANGVSVFMRVTLPLTLPGISAGSVIVFCLAASGFVTPALVGGAAVPVMPYLVYKEGLLVLNWPFASAVALILLVATALVTAIYTFAFRDGASKTKVVR
jgi:putative spermidine/putrescine transport system permease protein